MKSLRKSWSRSYCPWNQPYCFGTPHSLQAPDQQVTGKECYRRQLEGKKSGQLANLKLEDLNGKLAGKVFEIWSWAESSLLELLKSVTLVLSQPAAMGRPEGWGIPRGSQVISKTGRRGVSCGGEAKESHAWKVGGPTWEGIPINHTISAWAVKIWWIFN